MKETNKIAIVILLVGVFIAAAILSGAYFAGFFKPEESNRDKLIGKWEGTNEDGETIICTFYADGTGYFDGTDISGVDERLDLKKWSIDDNNITITPEVRPDMSMRIEYEFHGDNSLSLTIEDSKIKFHRLE